MNVFANPAKRLGGETALSAIILNDHGWINGGQAKVAIDSALNLKEAGLDVCFVAGTGPLDERLIQAGIECHVAGKHDILSNPNRLRAATQGIWNSRAARVLDDCIAARDPRRTVVHAHGWAKALSPSIGPVLTRSDAAHVYTLHEYFLACPNGGFFHYGSREICRRRPLGFDCLTARCDPRNDFHKAWRVARQAVLKSAGDMPHGLREIIYLAPEQKSIMAPYISPEARWHLLPNPVSCHPARRVRAERNDMFLFIGRMSPEKGAEVAALAARKAGVPIAFCGAGQCRDAVRRANPDALMLGWLGEEELNKWIRKARCVLFPSLWYECYPLVVADALALGLPIVVSNSCVATALVEDGVNGLHAEPGNVDDWAEAMTRLRSDALVQTLGEAAFKSGRQLLSQDQYTTRLIRIYEDVIQKKHGAALPRALEVPSPC
jgi:glycosyltransferase involved in cell wall biosynthesis